LLYQQRRIVAILFTPTPAKERAVSSTFVYSSRVTFLPILRRELAVASRRTGTYRQRVLFAGLAVVTVAIMLLSIRRTALSGPMIFSAIAFGGFLLSALEGMRASADSIALERREGTLGLLLLTGLRGRQIVIGKVAAACVQSLSTVLAILPAFALPLLLGGVTAGECWRVMLTFVATLLFTLTVGALVSSWATQTLTAFVGTFALMLALTGLPMAFALYPSVTASDEFMWLAGPLEMFHRVKDSEFLLLPSSFWSASAWSLAMSAVMFAAAGFILERRPRLEVKNQENWLQRLLRPRPVRAESWGGGTSQSSPAVWLAARTLPGQRVLWILVGSGAGLCFLAGCFAGPAAIPAMLLGEVFFAYLIKLWLAAVAPQSLNMSRRNGALELLLCTPLTPQELVRGQVDALYNYFIGPALAIAAVFPIAGILGLSLGQNTAGMNADASLFALGLFWFLFFVLDLHALAYTGLWNGLTHARVDRAITKTVFAVLILPWLTLVVPFAGCFGVVGWPVFWMNWASKRLNNRFREEASTHFSVEDEKSGWLPWSRK
jgi:ABC-type transport system involved in multi-copper enzyme maturation permease subunit